MPQAFKVDCWTVFFWANESRPLEPVHVHVSRKRPKKNATKDVVLPKYRVPEF